MPLTKTGKKVKAAMKREYGARKGEDVFYGYENKNRNNKKGKMLVKAYPKKVSTKKKK